MLPNIHDKDYRVLDLVRQREIRDSVAYAVSQKLHVTENLISRLGLEKELVGHTGCVNCLEWNESGQILASASDDMNIILWDPFRYEKKLILRTRHHGNIFSVKFMPKSNDRILVSGAGDGKVRVRDLTLLEPIFSCNCHIGRVKRIATATTVPFLFWSAAEDGLILQYDIRAPHSCKSNGCNSVLVNLVNHAGRYAEGKCISVNPKKPELIAIGANDAYIRMYDRRMIKLSQVPISSPHSNWTRGNVCIRLAGGGDPDENVPLGCAQYFIAGHLHSRQRDSNRSLTTTYLTFSADGNELLVNMGGEQIYLFDINNPKNLKTCFGYSSNMYLGDFEKCSMANHEDIADFTNKNIKILPPHVEELKRQANESFEQQKYTLAINLYNKAICYCPTAAVLFANRAAAYMKRTWDGDIYAALKDCQTTLLLDPGHVKAHFRLARCLFDLHQSVEADKIIKDFQQKFPEYASNSACKALKMDIKEAIDSGRDIDMNQLMIQISEYEQEWRRNTIDYKMRFCGHCNTTTDIKEANFFGNNGQYIVAGSDDGSFFIWDRNTTNIIRVLRGDERIVNCLQPHPSTCLLATSGIDPVVRLWSPLPEDGSINEREIQNLEDAASANQIRMKSDPFEIMLMNMGYRFPVQQTELNEDGDDNQDQSIVQPLNCRPS
ncbi:WD and tetratricopeptide repeats protein 1-like isoform X1 [Bombus pascuorum]|uniref:WD and tetratricopeptide repeats protein 1-like isoform X1 n=2 Tax=Bombus pascuorum TaxID=65598 RepID=UPI00298E3ADF|nr:WD and tetratricopeptide repeats protein 1-like isoform X1 [Bombus pascuorum]XP_060813251.1 WD and tetratricopeptide repeats protein 1-like isoform X1 [Bombus pascuorum]XP_060813252.1 WD and tetratricopeptide repeats protein 1-like isoform X1 [Bombus pascuorum]XP_060813253.1 WD and tetratricopeptide repeats protein 1-like isoform X1 [Bombus pascuorum]XP_060813254.1 WD and tetratricopeptide repeats protein 1-like isoform X1 [Bombus pascuorum]